MVLSPGKSVLVVRRAVGAAGTSVCSPWQVEEGRCQEGTVGRA